MTAVVVHLVPRLISEQVRWISQLRDDARARRLAIVVVDGVVRLLRAGAVYEHAALVGLLPIAMRFADEDWMEEVTEMMVTIPSAALRRAARRHIDGRTVTPAQRELLARLVGVDHPATRAHR
jgi:hypothetical protein